MIEDTAAVRAHHREACLDAVRDALPAMQFDTARLLDRIERVMSGRTVAEVVDLFRAGLA